MAFKDKNKEGKKFEKGVVTNPEGRPRKLHSQIIADLKAKGAEAISKNHVQQTIEVLMSLTRKELIEMGKDDSVSIVYNAIARALVEKDGYENLLKAMDRAHGKPMITQEIKQENIGDTIQVIFQPSTVKPITSESDFLDD